MADFSQFPENHRRASGRYSIRLEDGTSVALEILNSSRPLRGNEMVKASMEMRMGRLVSHRVDEISISLFVGRAGRMDIEFTASGGYRYGRYFQRSLRDLIEQLVDKVSPQKAADVETDVDPATPGFSR